MELSEFVDAALREILVGVKQAQQASDGANINAEMPPGKELGGALINGGSYGVITRVDFDVSVSAETSGGAGAKLVIWGAGIKGGAKHTAASANRISFSVPVRLPDGDSSRAKKVREAEKQKRAAQSNALMRSARMLNP